MSNAHAVKPVLPEPFPRETTVWTCPITGLKVPKTPAANLLWRTKLLRDAEADRGLQQELYTASSLSVLFWVNAFAFTFRIQETDDRGRKVPSRNQHLPWVTWEIQDRHILALEDAVNTGTDLLTDKTRDMGSTWNHIAVFHHQWLFRPDSLFLEMSRVETDVDGADNPRCLFVKHDYINRWLPEWMRPAGVLPGGKYRTRMHLVNPTNSSRIDGESSNKAAGSGDRRKAILLDEFAKMENATKIKAATADVTPCRLPNSTPWGAGTTYSKWRQSGQITVFVLPWWEHPEKGKNRYVAQDEATGKYKVRSPWYDAEAEKRTPQEMAQEIDMDHIGSGATFFESHILDQHKRLFGKPAPTTRSIDFKKGVAVDAMPDAIRRCDLSALVVRGHGGPWRIWPTLINGRLDQTKNYVFGIDTSRGQGASNSVVSVRCLETHEKVAEFADANVPPYDLARLICAAAIWVGGARKRPMLIWEANGPGWDTGRQIVKVYNYPLYYHDRSVGGAVERRGRTYGWHSSRQKKEILLGMYRRSLAHGTFINHSEESLDEAAQYIYYEDGGLGPAALIEENESARKTHGDRVIADALTLLGDADAPRTKPSASQPPYRSMAWRRHQLEQNRRKQRRQDAFDFRT